MHASVKAPLVAPLVLIPTYNERKNLREIVRRTRQALPAGDVLIIDDDSPDGTGELANSLAGDDRQVHVLHRRHKEGLGAAYIAGFRWGLHRHYSTLVEMDADGSHAPEELPRLLAALREADVVLGSRWVVGGVVRDWPFPRMLLSRGGNAYARLALGVPLRDLTGGFRAYRRAVLESLPLAEVASQGYCFQVDLAWRAWRGGFAILEVPITFSDRSGGESKMSSAIVREALRRLTVWAIAQRGGQVRKALQSWHVSAVKAARISERGPVANAKSRASPDVSQKGGRESLAGGK